MDLCLLEEPRFNFLPADNKAKSYLAEALHLRRYTGGKLRADENDNIWVSSKTKQLFGKSVPHFCFCLDPLNDEEAHRQCLEVPAPRFLQALQRMIHTYGSDRKDASETFTQWGARKGTPFLTELLEDFMVVGPDDIHELLLHIEEDMNLLE